MLTYHPCSAGPQSPKTPQPASREGGLCTVLESGARCQGRRDWVGEYGRACRPELIEEEDVSQVSRLYSTPCLACIKFPTNGSY